VIGYLKRMFTRSPDRLVAAPLGMYRPFANVTSDAGVDVTPQTAEAVGTVYACVNLIAQDTMDLPVRVCRRLDRGRERFPRHPVARLLSECPNDYMAAFTFREVMTRSVLLRGYAVAYIKKVGSVPVSLHPLPTGRVRPHLCDGVLTYRYIPLQGDPVTLTPDQVIHLIGPSDDGIFGRSPIDAAPNAVGIAIQSDKFAARFFAAGTALSGYLKYPQGLDPEAEAELRTSWSSHYAGADNAHGVPVLGEGAEFVPLSVTPEQAQFLQSRQFQFAEICRLFRVHPGKLGDKLPYAGYASVQADHVRNTIRPWLSRWEQEVSRKLLTEAEKADGYYVELDADGLMRGDRDAMDKSFATGIQFGWYSKNDVRDMLNLPPIPGGDDYLTPVNMAPAAAGSDQQDQQTEQQTGDSEQNAERSEDDGLRLQTEAEEARRRDAARLNPIYQDAIRRCLSKEVNAIKRQAGKDGDLMEWAAGWYEGHEGLVRSAVLPALAAFDPAEAHRKAEVYAERHVAASLQDIRDAITFDALPDLYEQWLNRRAYRADMGDLWRS
jgi:HK97 family phage portal protein